jgi:hypothetical protein
MVARPGLTAMEQLAKLQIRPRRRPGCGMPEGKPQIRPHHLPGYAEPAGYEGLMTRASGAPSNPTDGTGRSNLT